MMSKEKIKAFLGNCGILLYFIVILCSPPIIILFDCLCRFMLSQLYIKIQFRFLLLVYHGKKHFSHNILLANAKPDFHKMQQINEKNKIQYRKAIRKYYVAIKSAYLLLGYLFMYAVIMFVNGIRWLFAVLTFQYNEYQKKKLLYILDTNASNPFYYSLFSFLNVYFGVYYILPGKFVIDKLGIMHVIIQISERIKDGLSPLELGRGIQLRLINALKNSEQLFYIPSEYWTENTVYAPQVEANLKKKQVVIYIALSIAGAEHIQKLQQQEKQPIYEDMEETL